MPRLNSIRPAIQVIGPSIAYVPLTQGQWALVDTDSLPVVGVANWCAMWSPTLKGFYAVRKVRMSGKFMTLYMHRAITDAPQHVFVDHRNGNTLNNLRMNLRFATAAQSAANRSVQANNSSGYSGVRRRPSSWEASIKVDRKRIRLGSFATKAEAIAARERAESRLHGEFVRPKVSHSIGTGDPY